MATKKHIYAIFISHLSFLLFLISFTACTAQSITTAPTPLPANTLVPPNATPTYAQVPPSLTPTIKPFADLNEWDLLVVNNSTNWGVGLYYARLIEADMNVKVNLHDCWQGSLAIKSVLYALESDANWLCIFG